VTVLSNHLATGAIVIAMLSLPAHGDDAARPLESTYYDLIGIGCVPWSLDGESFAWRMASDLLSLNEAQWLSENYEAEDTRRCRAAIVAADEALESRVLTLDPSTPAEEFEDVVIEIHRA
jgi:hypothetical protein